MAALLLVQTNKIPAGLHRTWLPTGGRPRGHAKGIGTGQCQHSGCQSQVVVRWRGTMSLTNKRSDPARGVRLADKSGGQPPQSKRWRDCRAVHWSRKASGLRWL